MLNRRKIRILRNTLKRPGALLNLVKLRFFLPLLQRSTSISATPAVLDIEPTAKCNLRCKYCQVSYWDRSEKVKNLSYEQFVHIVDQFPHLLQIKLQGMGEPLLNSDFFKMVAYADQKGIIVRTVTNATLIMGPMAEKIIKSPLAELTISVDGATKETYEHIRRGGKFDRVVENIRNLVRLRKEQGDGRTPMLTVWMVGTKDNIHEFPQLIRLAKELGVDKVYLQHHLNFWGTTEYQKDMAQYAINREDTDSHYTREVERILAESRNIAKTLGMPLTVYTGNTLFQDQKCGWPWTSAYISADGFVVPCCIVANPQVMQMGNLFHQKFADIWNSQKYRAFRKLFMDRKPPKMCNGCYVGCGKSNAEKGAAPNAAEQMRAA